MQSCRRSDLPRPGQSAGTVLNATEPTPTGERSRTEFLGLWFDDLDTEAAVAWIRARSAQDPLAYVVTPNVDHMVRLPKLNRYLRRAYDEADLVLCDSRVLQRLALLVGVRLKKAPGSDLTRLLFETLQAGDRLCLLGGDPDYVPRLAALYPDIKIDQHIAPMGLLHNPAARAAAIATAARVQAPITLIAVGSPQQELMAHEMRLSGKVRGTVLCIGASVDFIVGNEKRAPYLVQKAGIEWAWRLGSNPRKMAKRYLLDCPAIFPLVLRWARARRGI